MNLNTDTLYYGDCLEVIEDWPNACVDLIYLDPPFNSNVNYNILFRPDNGNGGTQRQAQTLAFADTWRWDYGAAQRVTQICNAVSHPAHKAIVGLRAVLGETGMLAYVSYMAERLSAMRRLLKPTGSIFLHCDPTASHYLKVLLDSIFGGENFRNEIVWKRRQDTHNLPKHHMGRIHDTIFWYAQSEETPYNELYLPYDEAYVKSHYKHVDANGKYRLLPCTNETGGNRPYTFRGITRAWRFSPKNMAQMYESDLLVQLTPKGPWYYKKYLAEAQGVPMQDLWDDIGPARGKERIGYPTQKPVALLERILHAATREGDVVLDPFCGCGTTIAAAHELGLHWMGIDVSPFAIELIVRVRFQGLPIQVMGIPADMEGASKLAREKPFDFEKWAISRIPGLAPNSRQTGDSGVDGRGTLILKPDEYKDRILAQVKGGSFNASQLRDFMHTLENEKAALGVFITLRRLAGRQLQNARAVLAGAGSLTLGASTYPRAQLWSIEDYFMERMPRLPDLADPFTGKAIPEAMQTRFF